MWKRFAILAILWALPATGQTTRGAAPLVVLNHDTGNFFVLASDLPFRVSKADPRLSWFDVERVQGPETAHRTVELVSHPAGRSRGAYFGAVRIDIETAAGSDFFLIPVALRVGAEHRNALGRARDLEASVPARNVRLASRDPNVELRVRPTPGGHYLVEILDLGKQARELASLSAEARALVSPTQQTYELVFPWMCLEYPCGIPTQSDIDDVNPYVSLVSAISYERYAMHGGTFRVLSGVGDPGDWGKANRLRLWPMAIGGYQPSESQINAMWAGRETIAQGMIDAAGSRGYEGYCIDVEGHAQGNSKNVFINLVSYLANRLHDNGFKLMVAHATWSTIAPIDDLAVSPVDYVATMDPYTSRWQSYIPELYRRIDASRLVWGFTWDQVTGGTQRTMWQWMQAMGYNDGVAGAAGWRTPLANPANGVNYYTEGFETYYPMMGDGLPNCINDSVPTDHWKGEYFLNQSLQGTPASIRDDGAGELSFVWGSGSPNEGCGLPADGFSARFRRQVAFEAGIYRFRASSDDGIRVTVGSEGVFDEWRDQVADFEREVAVSAGSHAVLVEYYENGGGATLKLSWEKIADIPVGGGVVVDDPELLVTSTGKMEWWYRETGVGHEGDMVWTLNTATRMDNFARWKPILPGPERYRVEAFLPRFDKASTQARYQIRASGVLHAKVINQEASPDQWVDLGTYEFLATNDGSEYVELADVTGETSVSRKVLFDAIRFTPETPPNGCLASVAPDRWKGEYFAGPSLGGAPLMIRDDGVGALDFDWGTGSPSPGCQVPSDGFSVRWTRTAAFEAGTYSFTASADDGLRVKVGTTTVFDEWRDQHATFRKELPLPTGEHTVTVEHYENGGGAMAKLDWQPVATTLVDDPELLVTSTGKMEWWHLETGVGHEGDLVWTLNTYSRRDNYARWTPSLPAAGWYLVEAFIPNFNSPMATTRARYSVVARGRTYGGLEVNQSASGGKWVPLGTFEFDGSGNRSEYVELGDVTAETSVSRNVLFDAVRLTPSPSPPPDGGWAFPVGSAESGAGWSVVLGLGQSWTSTSGKQYNGHLAEDWARAGGSLGQPVYAAADGVVIINLQNCGNYVDVVILEHQVPGLPEPIYSMYGHIQSNGFVEVGDTVKKRQQIGIIGDPVTFAPHLHFEVKNRTALVNPPFSGCSSIANGIYISAGYSGKRNDFAGGDFWDPSNDEVSGNLYYHPTRFIQNRLSTALSP